MSYPKYLWHKAWANYHLRVAFFLSDRDIVKAGKHWDRYKYHATYGYS